MYHTEEERLKGKVEARMRFQEKNPKNVNIRCKKHYWIKQGFSPEYFNELYDKFGDISYNILKLEKKLETDRKKRLESENNLMKQIEAIMKAGAIQV